jgi:hypothetical protein
VRCSLLVSFRPTTPGAQAAKLRLVAGAHDVRTREVSGAGVESPFWVGPRTSLNFGSVPVNMQSAPQVVRITNFAGAPPLAIESIRLGGEGASQYRASHDCPLVLAPDSGCSIRVTLSPRLRGNVSAMLVITPTASPARSVPLAGAGN